MDSPSSQLIFDSEFLAKLEQLYLLSKKLFRSDRRADRKSRQIGSSLEFADFRNYASGDDLRNVDWNIYGRLERLVVKLFEQEQDLQIHFLLDASESMRWKPDPGRPSKFDSARRIVASLAYIGLANLDRVNIHWFGSALGPDLGLARGKSQFHNALEFLRNPPDLPGPTQLRTSFQSFAQRLKRRGLVFVVSDLFDPAGPQPALGLLREHELHLVQVLDPAELSPTLTGDLQLQEIESGEFFPVTANEAVLRRYRQEVDSFLSQITDFCLKRGLGYARASTALPFEDFVLQVLREGRLLK